MTLYTFQVPLRDTVKERQLSLVRRSVVNFVSALRWAWLDVVCQYRRSRIGPFWETINVAVMVAGLSFVSSGIFGGNASDLVGYIGLGLIVWTVISSSILDGCTVFIRNAGQIQSSNVSIDVYLGRTVIRIFITFAHQILLYIIGLAFGFLTLSWPCLLALPGILLLFLNAYWIGVTVGFLCARFRDLELIIRNLLQVAFLVTPVFWNYQHIQKYRGLIADYNPLFHLISIVRAPLLGIVPDAESYFIVGAITIAGYFIAYAVYRRMRRPLAFYV